MKSIDIRSDTVTHPTHNMRVAMRDALIGDDVFGEDPTVIILQQMAAQMLGKQAALFTPSGVMSNNLAVMTWTNPGDQIILWENAHIVDHQTSACSVLAGVQTRQIASKTGILTAEQIEAEIRKEQGILFPRTTLIAVENSLSNGKVWPLDKLKAVREVADKYKLRVHMDGARLWNAKATLDVDVKEIVKYVDSVAFCLSKGLCCPIGSLLVGSKAFIDRARYLRKSIGGGMRQVGIIAAAGIVALKQQIQPLKQDHRIAKFIGIELSKLNQIEIDLNYVQTNMVFFRITNPEVKPEDLIEQLSKHNIKMNMPFQPFYNYRIACHYYIRQKEAQIIIRVITEFLIAKRK